MRLMICDSNWPVTELANTPDLVMVRLDGNGEVHEQYLRAIAQVPEAFWQRVLEDEGRELLIFGFGRLSTDREYTALRAAFSVHQEGPAIFARAQVFNCPPQEVGTRPTTGGGTGPKE